MFLKKQRAKRHLNKLTHINKQSDDIKMAKKIFVIVCLAFFMNQSIYSSVEKVTYRKWLDCYKITNGTVEVILNAGCGGRVMEFSYNGINMIYKDSTQDGKLITDFLKERFDPDGGRFDYGPESVTNKLHSLTWMGEWSAKITGDFSLVLTSQPDYKLGVQTIREFKLDKNSCLSIKQTMKNISDTTIGYFFWSRTLVYGGGKLVVPLNPESQYPQGWGKWDWSVRNGVLRTEDVSDPAVKTMGDILLFTPNQSSPRGKYGTDSHEGWMAYGYKDVLFVKRFKYFPDKLYIEKSGQTIVFFTNGKFIEMEPISPQIILEPGESSSFTESWWLLPYETSKIDLENLDDVSKIIYSNTGSYNH